jgi:hypothetical protein
MAYMKGTDEEADVYLNNVAEPLDDEAMRRDLLVDRRGPGRPRGSKNLSRPGFREMTYEVLNSVEMGGLQGYIQWAVAHKSDFYGRLCPKLFGGEFNLLINGSKDQPIQFTLKVPVKALDMAQEPDPANPTPFLDPIHSHSHD